MLTRDASDISTRFLSVALHVPTTLDVEDLVGRLGHRRQNFAKDVNPSSRTRAGLILVVIGSNCLKSAASLRCSVFWTGEILSVAVLIAR